mgnify:CR=1 FL=1
MNTVKMKISELIHPEKNVRRHSEKQIQELLKSVRMFGQIRPVVVDENNVILAGNGLVEAMRLGGYEEADVLVVNGLTDAQKKKLMIADNRIYALGNDHWDNILEFLQEIGEFDVPGFDEDFLRAMLAEDEDIEEELESYGVLEQEEVEEFRRAGERLQHQIDTARQEEAAAPTPVQASASSPTSDQHDVPASSNTEVDAAPRRTPCPHCGGKGWL